jgi:hypothetical protein
MKKWKQILGVALLIILGGLGGSIVTKAYLVRWHLLMGSSSQARTDYIMRRLPKELSLREDQKTKIEAIVRQLEEEGQKRKRENIERMMKGISGELDGEQQKKLEVLKKRSEMRKKRLEKSYLRQGTPFLPW